MNNAKIDVIEDAGLFAHEGWFYKRSFTNVQITTNEIFGFYITREKI